MSGSTLRTFVVCAVFAAAMPASAQETQSVQDPPPKRGDKDWTYKAGLYFWPPGLSGEATVDGITVETDRGSGDLFEELGTAFQFWGEAWSNDRIGILADFSLTDTHSDANLDGGGEANLDYLLLLWEVAGAYRWRHDEAAFDLIVGLRGAFSETEIDVSGGPSGENEKFDVEPMIGTRVVWDINKALALSFRVDVGGFGIGRDLSSQMMVVLDIAIADSMLLQVGYRALGVVDETDDVDLDYVLHGFLLGFAVAF